MEALPGYEATCEVDVVIEAYNRKSSQRRGDVRMLDSVEDDLAEDNLAEEVRKL